MPEKMKKKCLKLNSKDKYKMKKHNKKKGFTLVELIVVIAIIAILAASLTPSFTGYITEAKKVKVIDQAKNVVTAYESVNAKSPGKLNEDSSVSTVRTTSGLLEAKDIDKLGSAKVQDCLDILDSEKHKFTIDSSGNFEKVYGIDEEITSNTPAESEDN